MSTHPTILFDGVCNLCNGAVNFIIARDPEARFRFASIQSPAGTLLLNRVGVPPSGLDTLVFVDGDQVRVRSDAVLAIAERLGGAWRLLATLRIIPAWIRDFVYRFVASHRYRLFGRTTECALPRPELRFRFLDDG